MLFQVTHRQNQISNMLYFVSEVVKHFLCSHVDISFHMTISFLESLPFDVRMECFGFLRVQDLGYLASASKILSEDTLVDTLWQQIYPSTFNPADVSGARALDMLINRPYKKVIHLLLPSICYSVVLVGLYLFCNLTARTHG